MPLARRAKNTHTPICFVVERVNHVCMVRIKMIGGRRVLYNVCAQKSLLHQLAHTVRKHILNSASLWGDTKKLLFCAIITLSIRNLSRELVS